MDPSAPLLLESSSHLARSSPLSPAGVADRTGVVPVYWDLEGVPRGYGDDNHPLCSSDASIPWVERYPRGRRLAASLPSKKAAVIERCRIRSRTYNLQVPTVTPSLLPLPL